jgi:hypothetical protein
MARIETTIWDLAMAVDEQADAGTSEQDEAFELAFCALANLLHDARLDDGTEYVAEAAEPELLAAG